MQASTKAQIQIGEIVAVIIVFVLLMVFGLYWFSNASLAANTQQAIQFDRTDLLETQKVVRNMPELQCSIVGVDGDAPCIDLYRIHAVQAQRAAGQDDILRSRFIGTARGTYAVRVHDLQTGTNYTVFDYHRDERRASYQSVFTPVVLYNPIDRTRHFSILNITQQVIV